MSVLWDSVAVVEQQGRTLERIQPRRPADVMCVRVEKQAAEPCCVRALSLLLILSVTLCACLPAPRALFHTPRRNLQRCCIAEIALTVSLQRAETFGGGLPLTAAKGQKINCRRCSPPCGACLCVYVGVVKHRRDSPVVLHAL